MRYETGLPSSVIRFMNVTLRATASRRGPDELRESKTSRRTDRRVPEERIPPRDAMLMVDH